MTYKDLHFCLFLSLIMFVLASNRCTVSDDCCSLHDTDQHSATRFQISCPQCRAEVNQIQRIRKEIRTLSPAQLRRFFSAVNVMKTLSSFEGIRQFGAAFKNYDYFVAKHFVAAKDIRGDQGHFSSAFMTFHGLFVLEFENCILSIDPQIGALPYWNWNDTSSSVFTNDMFGSAPGSGFNGQVVDGAFANWTIARMSSEIWSSRYVKYLANKTLVNASALFSSGYLRTNEITNPKLTRYGVSPTTGVADNCATHQNFPWISWYSCIEVVFEIFAPLYFHFLLILAY